jgi:hypothetical protein
MIATTVKWLLYVIIGLILVGVTSPLIVPLFILALCIRWLIKNRHNTTTEDTEEGVP